MNQLAIPVEVPLPELMRKQTLGAAIEMCVELSGHPTKAVLSDLHVDKAQLSRWHSGAEGVVWPKLAALMDHCGNDAPVLWQLHQRGYDLHSVRRRESELERQVRMLTEERDALRRVLAASSGAAR